jgi:hypothetical protein
MVREKRTKIKSREAEGIIRQAIVQLFAVQLATGTSIVELRKFALACAESAPVNAGFSQQSAAHTDIHIIGSVLRSWHREAKYLSDDGNPKPLRVNGRGGLRELVSRYYPPEDFDEFLLVLKRAKLIRRDARGRWRPSSKFAVLPRVSSEMNKHIGEGVSRFVETVTRNLAMSEKENALFERAAKVQRFPKSELADFRSFVQQQASAFLVAVDDWMEARAEAHESSRGKKCTVGVFTFAFTDEARVLK